MKTKTRTDTASGAKITLSADSSGWIAVSVAGDNIVRSTTIDPATIASIRAGKVADVVAWPSIDQAIADMVRSGRSGDYYDQPATRRAMAANCRRYAVAHAQTMDRTGGRRGSLYMIAVYEAAAALHDRIADAG